MAEKKPSLEELGLDFNPHPKRSPQPRVKPMEVLCLGLSRTGTMSTYVAMNKLGLNCYHAVEQGRDSTNGSIKFWYDAIEAKYFGGKTKKLETAEDFDRFLSRYQAVTDIPCILFSDELMAAYPEAKVVLTTRDEDGWIRSMQNSYYNILSWKVWPILQLIDRENFCYQIPEFHYILRIWTGDDEYNIDKLRQGYRAHNKHIREVVPKGKFLEWHPRDGWEPLCRFLGKPIPDEPMPHVNEGEFVADLFRFLVKLRFFLSVVNILKVSSPVWLGGIGWWAYQRYYAS